ncbi:MAG TPA: hypothetical protein VH518_13290, partial [Tepidisphaeraceae bacterium]|jgi:prepilin-type processing-associated H-X9-DG protein
MFANDHRGWMPSVGGSKDYVSDSSGAPRVTTDVTQLRPSANWIAWQRVIDPVTGTNIAGTSDQNITYSGLAPYLGAKPVEHKTPDGANDVNRMLDSVFRCPSDNLQQRPNADPTKAVYRYSYSMNELYAAPVASVPTPTSDGATYKASDRYGGSTFNGKYTSIKGISDKILFICEDETTLDDGQGRYNPNQWMSGRVNAVASRHQTSRAARSAQIANSQNVDAYGNVAFADGHGAFISRLDALRGIHTGRPDPDPKPPY